MAKVTCSEGRKRLDETLASRALAEKDNVSRLVQHQLIKSSLPKPREEGTGGDVQRKNNIDKLVEKRSAEVWNVLEMLRSAAGNETEECRGHESSTHGWKLKQDNDQFRVMYREGPDGTLFHTLLVEGYIDGPVDSSLCVGVESTLYPHWWPQFSLPAFKIIESRCLKKVRIGEEISLIRVKVPWPISSREIIFHYFELEYFEDDLLVVLLSSVPNSQQIDESIHGYSPEDIPPVDGTVRMELVGGFALQKVNSTQSYFRTIGNLDIKVDFMPSWLINFISRQLIGHGFKLYQKTVLAASHGDENFRKILDHGPMYIRVQAGLRSSEENKQEKKSVSFAIEELAECKPIEERITDDTKASGDFHSFTTSNRPSTSGIDLTLSSEIETYDYDASTVSTQGMDFPRIQNIDQARIEETVSYIDPEIQMALKVLDRAIAFIQEHAAVAASSDQCRESVTNSEPILSNGILKGLNESVEDHLYKGDTQGSFLPGGKLSQKLYKIGNHEDVTRKHHKYETNNNLRKGKRTMENDVPTDAKHLKVKSKHVSCFACLSFPKK
eukprot:Gb_36362 [translate_table: standard]